jgi:hypothetical protein
MGNLPLGDGKDALFVNWDFHRDHQPKRQDDLSKLLRYQPTGRS